MTDRMKNILLGLFVTGALAIAIGLILFLKPTVGDGRQILNVRFTNIGGISVGTRVTFAGKPVGEVTHIQELSKARDEADEQGRIYLYQLTLKLDSGIDVYSSDEVAIKTTGLMGEKSIAILPKVPLKGTAAHLITDQTIYASSTDPLEHTFNQIAHVANRLEGAIGHLDQWFTENQAHVATALKSFDGAMGQIGGLMNVIQTEKLVPLLTENMQLVRSALEDDQLLHKFASLAENLDQAANMFNTEGASAMHNLNQITRDIASGSGTVGRLISGDDCYLRLASLMNKGETLMNDINHYGILFQYNKQWQRGRTKRANLLKALDTPEEFRSYFESEVDGMSTALGRLSELMERAGESERTRITQSDAFKRGFAALMRQTQGLSDSLKLYNEGLLAETE